MLKNYNDRLLSGHIHACILCAYRPAAGGMQMAKLEGFLARCQQLAEGLRYPGMPGQVSPSKRRQFVDNISSIFLDGYDAAMHTDVERLVKQLESLSYTERSIAGEGALTALASADLRKQNDLAQVNRFSEIAGIQESVKFQGIGSALSHLRISADVSEQHMSEFWGWQTVEAFGFHEAYFKWPVTIERQHVPDNISGLAARAFDQGVGRAIWFISVAEPNLISTMIDRFAPKRRPDIWSGVGLITGFWGMADERDLKALLRRSRTNYPSLQQGVAFGSWIRYTTKDPKDFAEGASRIICKADGIWLGEQVQGIMTELLSSGMPPNGYMFSKWKESVAEIFTRPS